MAIITVNTPFNIDLEFKVAEFGKRISAWLIDIVIISTYYFLVLRFIRPVFRSDGALSIFLQIFGLVLPVLLYQLFFELIANGQTIGKMAVGIKIIDREGKEPTWGQYVIRWILCIGNLYVYIIPYVIYSMILSSFITNLILMFTLTIIYLPDFLSVLISSKSQRLGDLAAGTVVIDKNYSPDLEDTIYRQIVETDYEPVFKNVMLLTDRDINAVKDLLKIKYPSKDTEHYIIDVAQKIKGILDVESDLHPTDFLQQLLNDYNYYTTQN